MLRPAVVAVKMHAMSVVTLSASYGAGGSQVGPRLAERLGVAFLDRVIPTTVAERLAVPLDDALAHDDAVRSVLERLLLRFAPAAQAFSGAAPPSELVDERSFLRATEEVIRERAAAGSAVILGRAAAVVLADLPGALHVRLDGPAERRLAQAGSSRASTARRPNATCARPTVPARPMSSSSTAWTPATPRCTTWSSTRPRSRSTPASS